MTPRRRTCGSAKGFSRRRRRLLLRWSLSSNVLLSDTPWHISSHYLEVGGSRHVAVEKAKQKRHTHIHSYAQAQEKTTKKKTKKRSHPTQANCCRIRLVMSRWLVSATAGALSRHASNAPALHSGWHGRLPACVRWSRSRLLSRLSSLLSEDCERSRHCCVLTTSTPVSLAIDIKNIL